LGSISGMNLKIKYVIKDVDRYGVVRWYYRKPGCAKIKLPDPTHPTFLESVAAAQAAAAPLPPKAEEEDASLRWLIVHYYRSTGYKRLGKRTQHIRKMILDHLCERHGDDLYRQMRLRHFINIRDEKEAAPEAGNSVIKALRQVFEWALEQELVNENLPALVRYRESNNPDGFYTWSQEDIAAFIQKHPLGTKAYLALTLMLYTGARRSDVISFGPQMIKDGYLRFVQYKGRGHKGTRVETTIPFLPVIQEAIAACPSGQLTFLTTAFNAPFTGNGFGNWFKDRCTEAGLPQCSAHGLRKAGACLAAENGATLLELQALFGWKSSKMPDLYIRKAKRKLSTERAAQLFGGNVVQLRPANKQSNS
jgi:integrase